MAMTGTIHSRFLKGGCVSLASLVALKEDDESNVTCRECLSELRRLRSVEESVKYSCHGPFIYGTHKAVCVHGWNCAHALSEEEAQRTDKLTNAGLLPARQKIETLR